MANTKRVMIQGDLPFDLGADRLYSSTALEYERDAAQALREKIAYVAGPMSGIKLEWTKVSVRIISSRHGGQTVHYGFQLHGVDDLRQSWFEDWMVVTVLLGGRINYVMLKDTETSELLYDIGDQSSFGREADPALRLWIAGLISKDYKGLEFSI